MRITTKSGWVFEYLVARFSCRCIKGITPEVIRRSRGFVCQDDEYVANRAEADAEYRRQTGVAAECLPFLFDEQCQRITNA